MVAVLGITAYRAAYGRPRATAGKQPERLGGAQLWVVPNPSGLNAHSTLASLAEAYREVAIAAGLIWARSTLRSMQTYVLAGGCFWCLDAVYRTLKGVQDVVSGYTGGHTDKPTYQRRHPPAVPVMPSRSRSSSTRR